MRMPALLALTAFSLSACATSQSTAMVEDGYERGALGVAAIDRGDWATAEAQLMQMRGVGENNPERLINLGKVYMETGRTGMALSAWRLALASDNHTMVATRDGRFVSTRDLAHAALARHDSAIRSATR